MKYLILGSAGVVGLPLCSLLRNFGHEVLTYDIADSASQDLRNFNDSLLESYFEECDFVFHLAWDVGGSVYLSKYQHSFDFVQNNLKIMVNSFELLKRYQKPFIFASSQMSNMSFSSYGLTKAVGEKLTSSLNGLIVKFWNVYGYEHDLEKSHVITDFIIKARDHRSIDMMTDGTEQRQMLHTNDCSECLYTLSQQYTTLSKDKEYHITSFEWTDIRSIANIVAKQFPDTTIIPGVSKDTGQQDQRNQPDSHILNYWKPKISLEDGIKLIVEAMK
jgi:nucleoside-diphosphate-sugar epimerase